MWCGNAGVTWASTGEIEEGPVTLEDLWQVVQARPVERAPCTAWSGVLFVGQKAALMLAAWLFGFALRCPALPLSSKHTKVMLPKSSPLSQSEKEKG
ncbi:hypothetical protein SKAU_G00381240 [Synaphobranchus kaupii]|uniref:Uncharacterized protein n=1 Tax=Synaphobranchus kaupii TaxID=118154 RepID=A0A9Q1EDR0_SYNKA|nr:hypothetical protein SKAU_G00381240 [Synaphobranchus kaupii]